MSANAALDERSGKTPAEQSLINDKGHAGDSIFKGVSLGSGITILVVLALVGLFLILQSMPAFTNYSGKGNIWTYVAPFLFGTIWSAFLALLIAVPIAVGIALYISHYAPKRLAGFVGFVIDMLAAVPSVVFGLWGMSSLAPALVPIYEWLNKYFGWIPLFSGQVAGTGRNMATAAIVLAIMILPIITSLSREVFLRTPGLQEEASLALGATKWEMIRQVVFPYGRSGVVSAAMLGLGRALGETMAVAMVMAPSTKITFRLFTSQNPNTIAANIAQSFPEASASEVPTLMATGLVLFAVTFIVNFAGRAITAPKKDKSAKKSGGK